MKSFVVYGQGELRSPAEFLGYEPGSRFTPHHRVVAYLEHLAAYSSQIRLETYGQTHEGRPLLLAIVSSPENMTRLEEIRQDNMKRVGYQPGPTSADAPALVWLSYSVHGNESVSTEAALVTLYDLVRPDRPDIQEWLKKVVVLIDPCVNPDGRDRYVHGFNQLAGRYVNVAPEAREHDEPWPSGRTNHYYFDLNRDWAWATQVETQQRLLRYNQWMPHIHVDFHEQGVDEPYYFAPASEPYHAHITPWQRTLQSLIGQQHSQYFDQQSWLYFTRQIFDLFYPGYGDTWPTFNGAVGMTYEQGGSGRAGLGILTAEGDTLTLRDRIDHHHTTGLSTIEAAATHRSQIVQEFETYFQQARTVGVGTYKTYVVPRKGQEGKLKALTTLLRQQGIQHGFSNQSRKTQGWRYVAGTQGPVAIAPGDLLVNTSQPKGVLADVLFAPEAILSDSLSYDITAWALPYVYGLEAYALRENILPDIDHYTNEAETIAPQERPVAYLAPWKSFEDARFLAAILQQDIKLRFAEVPFEIEGRTYEAGTLILTRTGNDALGQGFDQRIRETAIAHGKTLYPVASGRVSQGADFGSSDVSFLERPRVAIAAGDQISSYGLGEVWHFFDQQLGYPATLIDLDDLNEVNLYRYDVLILPNGSYGRFFSDDRLATLKAWIRAGGRLVAMERAASSLAGKEDFSLKERKQDPEANPSQNTTKTLKPYAQREREAITDEVPGAIFRVQLDATHPLAFGYQDTYFTLKRRNEAYDFLEKGWNVGVLREDKPVSGFAGAGVQNKMKDTLILGVQTMGRGEVVYLLDDLLFRGFWYGGRLLFSNAVFLVGQDSVSAY